MLRACVRIVVLAMSLSAPLQADDVLLLRASNSNVADVAITSLEALGHTVTARDTLEQVAGDLTTFDTVWHLGFGPLTLDAQNRLIEFIQRGGGVHLTGISEVDAHNEAVENILNAVLDGPNIQLLTQGASGLNIRAANFNPGAMGGVTDGLDVLGVFVAGTVSGITDDENVLARGTEPGSTTLHDVGGIWNEQDMLAGGGRVTLIMDHEWPPSGIEEDDTRPIVDGIQTFLAGATAPPTTCAGDCNGSGTVNFDDLICVLFEFGDCTQPE